MIIPSLCFNLTDRFPCTPQHGWNCFIFPVNSWTYIEIRTFDIKRLEWAKCPFLSVCLLPSSVSLLSFAVYPDTAALCKPKAFITFREGCVSSFYCGLCHWSNFKTLTVFNYNQLKQLQGVFSWLQNSPFNTDAYGLNTVWHQNHQREGWLITEVNYYYYYCY